MVTKVNKFSCDLCGQMYDSLEITQQCEESHLDKSSMKIIRIRFDTSNTFGAARAFSMRVPKSLTVRFSDNAGDYAIYSLEHYGPKGV